MAVITTFQPYLIQTNTAKPITPITFSQQVASNNLIGPRLDQTSTVVPITPTILNEEVEEVGFNKVEGEVCISYSMSESVYSMSESCMGSGKNSSIFHLLSRTESNHS